MIIPTLIRIEIHAIVTAAINVGEQWIINFVFIAATWPSVLANAFSMLLEKIETNLFNNYVIVDELNVESAVLK